VVFAMDLDLLDVMNNASLPKYTILVVFAVVLDPLAAIFSVDRLKSWALAECAVKLEIVLQEDLIADWLESEADVLI